MVNSRFRETVALSSDGVVAVEKIHICTCPEHRELWWL